MGLDIFIDSKLRPWILEINDSPSLNIFIAKEGQKGLIKEPCEVDRFIKSLILSSTFALMMKTKKRKELESF